MVADHQQCSAGPDRRGETGEEAGPRLRRQLHELGGDKVEGVGFGRAHQEVAVPPLDAARRDRIGVTRVLGASLEGEGRDVSRNHPPTSSGQPDSVSPLAAPDVDRPPGPKVGDLGDELRVG